jgi:transcriptional regulator with XRE-family HTH domain
MPQKVKNQRTFFLRLGSRIRHLRREHDYSQEDMIPFGFSARHWQQIEAGRPITVSTLLRICSAFEIPIDLKARDNSACPESLLPHAA